MNPPASRVTLSFVTCFLKGSALDPLLSLQEERMQWSCGGRCCCVLCCQLGGGSWSEGKRLSSRLLLQELLPRLASILATTLAEITSCLPRSSTARTAADLAAASLSALFFLLSLSCARSQTPAAFPLLSLSPSLCYFPCLSNDRLTATPFELLL